MTALFGCTAPNQPAAQAPPASASVAAPTSPPPGGASSAPSSTSAAKARGGRPTIGALRAGLVGYFRDDLNLPAGKAQTAADCAVYPSYQELSAAGLTQLAQQNPAGLSTADEKVFTDVTTECVTSVNGD
ncbi:hypothetical protein GCM10011575_10000 [Microlunatus endophyticus]|uniref:Uncharacterized protein n=2 Tax=Microlunatus endophyticus TaxID=1716077 RepID=A0A917S253_9ACTN|nr:hypothetical protein GCM10011575_10000 [Microlunatus endophyticus]